MQSSAISYLIFRVHDQFPSLEGLEGIDEKLNKKYATIAREMGVLKKDIPKRSEALASTIAAVENKVKEGVLIQVNSPVKPIPVRGAVTDEPVNYKLKLRNTLKVP